MTLDKIDSSPTPVESQEHFDKKVGVARRFEEAGWDVTTEFELEEGFIADIVGHMGDEMIVIEVGSVSESKDEVLSDRYDLYFNVPYETETKTVVGTESRRISKSISFSDETYFRLMETKPAGYSFSGWVEKLTGEALNNRDNTNNS